jgi:hypothetical protein
MRIDNCQLTIVNWVKESGDVGFRRRSGFPFLFVWAVLLTAAIAMTGCSKDFEQKKLGKDSPEASRVRAMVDALRQGGEKGLAETMKTQAAGGLTGSQELALQASLRELIAADAVEVDKVDSFGPQVYRATLKLSTGGKTRAVALLLVATGDELRWAGRN